LSRKAAQLILYLTASPEIPGVGGRRFKVANPARSSMASNDETAALRLSQVCS
jgi:hypothetical protein